MEALSQITKCFPRSGSFYGKNKGTKSKKNYINEWSVLVVLVRGEMIEIYDCSEVVRIQMSP